jgi:hypothetical protein
MVESKSMGNKIESLIKNNITRIQDIRIKSTESQTSFINFIPIFGALVGKLTRLTRLKKLAYLGERLVKLNLMKEANQEFFEELSKSEEKANMLKEKMESIKQNVKTVSKRYLYESKNILLQVIAATYEVIDSIHRIKDFDLSEWTEQERR